MRYTFADVQREIARKLESLFEEAKPDEVNPAWVTQAIFADHPSIAGEDTDFYRVCSHVKVRDEVRQQLNRLTARLPDSQLTLEGFEHLQEYYAVPRNGEAIHVRIDLLDDDEIEAKIQEHESRGRGMLEHAAELRRYLDLRRLMRAQPHFSSASVRPHA